MARGGKKFKNKPTNNKHKSHRPHKTKNGSNYKHKFNKSSKRNDDKPKHEEFNKETKNENMDIEEDYESSSDSCTENETAFKKLVMSFTNNPTKNYVQSSSSESENEIDEDDTNINKNSTMESEDLSESENEEEKNQPVGKNKSNHDEVNIIEKEETIDDIELDEEAEKEDEGESKDLFTNHFNYEIDPKLLECVQKAPIVYENVINEWPKLGKLVVQIPKAEECIKVNKLCLDKEENFASRGTVPQIINLKKNSLLDLNIKSQIVNNIENANKLILENKTTNILTPLQSEIFSIINNYQDFLYCERTFQNSEEIRFIYCLHVINHILKTRIKILHHNARLSKKSEVPDKYRDQGLVRPKILIVVPFRDAALRIVKMFINILVPEEKGLVINKLRFMDDFSGGELNLPKKNPKPEDYEQLFRGNTDDTFRIGLSVTKKSLKLYTDFYSSDIIIASPLGLRVIVGASGEAERDYDFLASIEVMILDQAEQFLMQNWDHLIHVMDHLHMQPKQSHGTDFSRVRMWSLNGHARYYRQSLIFAAYSTPEFNSFFNRKCLNFAGKVRVNNPVIKGTICQVITQVPQVFHKINSQNIKESIESRLDFFKKSILSQYKDSVMKHTLIYVPSYFDYVRLRNFFKKEEINFVQICEYSKEAKIARARDMFYHSEAQFLLYSERFHHFRRIRLKGIRHIIFYQPPTVPHFYSEVCNFMQDHYQNPKGGSEGNMTITVLYTKYDSVALASIIGTERASRMLQSDKNTHMFVTGE